MTKADIALAMLKEAEKDPSFSARWLACDAFYGTNHKFIDDVSNNYYYFADIKANTQVWLERPLVAVPPYKGRGRRPSKKRALVDPISVSEIAKDPELNWETKILAEGAKGPIIAEVVCLRVIECRDNLPGQEVWLYIRKLENGKIKYALSNAPEDIEQKELDRVATMRWPIEQSFEESKKELGMDAYELRSWRGWHCHMLYVFLAMLFLLEVEFKFHKNNVPVITLPMAKSIVIASLSHDRLTIIDAIKIVNYHLKRNRAAYLSHKRKKMEYLQRYNM
jgi:SRSO17 transposase